MPYDGNMEKQISKDQQVTVSCYGGQKVQMILVEDLGDVLVVCSPEEIEDARRQGREPLTLGFKRESVAMMSAMKA